MKNRNFLQKNLLGFRIKVKLDGFKKSSESCCDLKKSSEKYFESQIARVLKKGLSLPIKSFSL